MSRKPESRLQLRIRHTLEREVGGWWMKVHGNEFQRAGLPDLIGCVRGSFFGFEVKRPGEKTTELQDHELESIRRAGGIAEVVTSASQAIHIVKSAIRDLTP